MKRHLIAVLVLLAALAAAAPRADRYALLLEDPPLIRQVASRADLNGPAARQAARRIDAAQQSLQRLLARRGFRVTGSVNTVLNAVFVEAAPERVAELRGLPGVRRVAWLPPLKLHLNEAVKLVNAPQAWNALGGAQNAGIGVKIGIIDTGIDQNHAAFQDPSLSVPAGFPKCSGFTGDCGAWTNNKVIVARSYVSDVAMGTAQNPAEDSRPDDLTPRDRVGHGTAAAMIAAGVQNTGPAGGGTTITGLAPKAFLGSYKIFGSPGVNDTTFTSTLTMALDDAVRDGMDVVTLSLGSPAVYGPTDKGAACGETDPNAPCDVRAQAIENAVSKGLVVVVSAGNDGDAGTGADGNPTIPTPNTIHTPGTAPSAITTGASTNSHIWFSSARVTSSDASGNLQNIPADFGDGPKPGGPMDPFPLRDVATLGNDGFACTGLSSGSLNNAIALIQRGNCSFVEKVTNAALAGARGVIIYLSQGDDVPFPPAGLAGTTIPTVIIGNTDGQGLKSFLSSHADAPVVLDPTLQAISAQFNTVASFSSHGPSIGNSFIKPDMVAVGTDLYTATETYDPNGELFDASGYTAVSGTSFSPPMVAGTVAMVKGKNRQLTAAQLKSAVVNTATSDVTENGQPAGSEAVGAGKLNAEAAVKTNVFVEPATLSFGVIGPASLPMNRVLKITNQSGNTVQLSLQGDSSQFAPLNPSSVPAGQTTSVTVTLQGSVPSPGAYQGFIVLRGGAVDVRVPFLYLVGDGIPYSIFPVVGNGFAGVINQRVPTTSKGLLAFKVVDRFGVPVSNADVVFKATVGGGSIDAADKDTDIYGIAAANGFLGPQLGDQEFTGSVTASGQTLTTYFDGVGIQQPAINTGGIVDAAMGLLGNGLAPGSYASIYGQGLSPATGGFNTPYLPLSLAGVSVSFDVPSANISLPGRLWFVSPQQINVQIPWELQGYNSVFVKVSIGNTSTAVYTLQLSDRLPAIYQYFDSSGQQMAAVTDAVSGALIGSSNPAKARQILTVYCNGLGPVDSTPADGEPTPPGQFRTKTVPTVTIGGKSAPVDFAGLSPGSIGLYQINVTVPDGAPSGIQPIIVNSNGVMSKAANLSVQ